MCIYYGLHLCFDTYSRHEPKLCLEGTVPRTPRPQPVLDLHDLRDWEGGLLLSSKIDFSSATKMLRWGSLRISSQLQVMHLNLRVIVGITFKNKDFNNVHCHYCTY